MSILYSPPHKNRKWQAQKRIKEDGTITYIASGKLHRENGAALQRPDSIAQKKLAAKEEYYKKGDLHRQSGPARIWSADLIKAPDTRLFLELPENTYLNDTPILIAHLREEWFCNGLRHRDNGPAIIAHAEEQYWQEGKLHREDGPAIVRGSDLSYLKPRHFTRPGHYLSREEYWERGSLYRRLLMNGTEEWFRDGVYHREDGPAVERSAEYVKSDSALARGENALFEYRIDGVLHREDGPALMMWDSDRACFHYQWFLEGVLENSHGPAELWLNGDKLWRKQGIIHREDGPAIILANGREEWHQEGKKSRRDAPAVIDGAKREYWYDGKLHRNEGPALCSKEKEIYYKDGKRHRLEGPALIVYGKYHEWYQNDLLHREDAPAVWRDAKFAAEKDLATEEYYNEGRLHKAQGAAKVYIDGTRMHYQKGKLHREDGPAIERSEARALRENEPLLEYYQKGRLHRIDGAARIWPGGKEEHWIEGIRYEAQGIIQAITQYTVLG